MGLPSGATAEPGDIAGHQADGVGPRHIKVLDHGYCHMAVLLFDLDVTDSCSPEAVKLAVKPRRHIVEVLLLHVLEHEVRYVKDNLLQFLLSEMIVVDHAREGVGSDCFPRGVQSQLANCEHFRSK